MMDETLQDDASSYVLRMLPPDEALAFEQRMEHDAELRDLVVQLESAAGHLAMATPAATPPPGLKERILSEVRHEVRVVPVSFSQRIAWLPWALAAALAIAATLFWQQNERLVKEVRAQEVSLVEFRNRDAFSNVQIAALSAKVADYEKALAVVVFDAEQQRGLVKFDRFPQPSSGKAYQLWVLPPGGKPVSGGVVPVDQEGVARVAFTPAREVRTIDAFAISVEPSGGSEQPRGEIILAGR